MNSWAWPRMMCATLGDEITDSAPPEKIPSSISQISFAAKRINAIITNLLDLNAIDSGERKLDLDSRDITGIVARVVQQNSHKALDKNIELVPGFG